MTANELAKMAVEGAPFTCAVGPGGVGLVLADARGNDVFDGDNESQALVKVMRVYNALAAQTLRAERAERALGARGIDVDRDSWALDHGLQWCEAVGWCVCYGTVWRVPGYEDGNDWIDAESHQTCFEIDSSGGGRWVVCVPDAGSPWGFRVHGSGMFGWPDRDAAWNAFCAARDAGKVGG